MKEMPLDLVRFVLVRRANFLRSLQVKNVSINGGLGDRSSISLVGEMQA